MGKPETRFIKAFTIHFRPDEYRSLYPAKEDYMGHMEPCDRQDRPAWQAASLNGYRITPTRFVGEKYLEEWVARRPDAIFGTAPILLLGAEKYGPKLGWHDLLFLDGQGLFHVAELKIERVAENAGELPGDIADQMSDYVKELCSGDLVALLVGHYPAFARRFYQAPRDLQAELERCFDSELCLRNPTEANIREIYVAADFDAQSRQELAEHSRETGHPARLVFFRFYLPRKVDLHPYIEFLEYPI